jgi:hypothetical protein
VQRFGPYALLALGCAGYGAAFAALGRVGDGSYYPILLTLGALAALIFPPTLALTAEWTAPETRASALAGFNVAGSLGFALGPVAGAWAHRTLGGGGEGGGSRGSSDRRGYGATKPAAPGRTRGPSPARSSSGPAARGTRAPKPRGGRR